MTSRSAVPGGYAPLGYLWDPWFVWEGGHIHLFHLLQTPPVRYDRKRGFERNRPVIGHAVWSEASGWEPRPVAVDYTGTEYDAERVHTGYVVREGGKWWMFYSGSRRYVCLATSDDLDTWEKHAANPIVMPDPALYGTYWRDPFVYLDPTDNCYTMLLAAQRPKALSVEVGVVGVARSGDLLSWEQEPPLDAPPWFEWLEVPELHRIGEKWFLLFVTQARWINEAGRKELLAQDVAPETGAFCFIADDWRGPYRRIQRLFPSAAPNYTTRLVTTPGGERWLWSHGDWEQAGERRRELLPPVVCQVAPDGCLICEAPARVAGRRG